MLQVNDIFWQRILCLVQVYISHIVLEQNLFLKKEIKKQQKKKKNVLLEPIK